MQKESVWLERSILILVSIILFCSFSLADFSNSRNDNFSSNSTIRNYSGVNWSSGNVSFYGSSNGMAFNISQGNHYIVSLSEATSIKGIANDGEYVYINDAGARIKVVMFNGTVISTHTVSGLGGDNNDLAHNRRFLYSRVGSTVYMINLQTNTSTPVTIDASKSIPSSDGWLTGNIVDMPDKRIGFISQSSVNPIVLRLYDVSDNGTYFSWSEDFNISSSWSTDNHGIVSDGDSLVLISHLEGHRIFSLINLSLIHTNSWNIRPTGIGNPTFITYDHIGKKVLIGDYGDRDFVVFNGSYSQGSFISTETEISSTITNITNVSWISSGDSLGSTVRVQISADNGTKWYESSNGNPINTQFSGQNTSLLYKVIFTTSSGANLSIDSVDIQWMQYGEDTLNTTIILPENIVYYNNSLNFNVTLNKNGSVQGSTDNGLNNFSFSTLDLRHFNYSKIFSSDGNYTLWIYSNDSSGNETNVRSINFTIYTVDIDGDGILDINDTLIGNESSVSNNGVNNFTIEVSGNSSEGTFSGVQELIFKENSQMFINFTHNFSQGDIDLNLVTIIKESNYIFLNFSGQLSGNKTVYLEDDDFDHLCVKDSEISSISNISSSCNSDNEINFDSCISSNITINGISCTNEGSRYKFSNLQHSGLRGSKISQSTENPDTGSSNSRSGRSCLNEWICSSWSFCSKDFTQSRNCELKYQNNCVPISKKPQESRACPDILFDVKATILDARIFPWEKIEVLVDLKEVNSNDLIDIELIYRISNNETILHEEKETISIQNNVSFIKEMNKLRLPTGKYGLEVILNYGLNQTASSLQPFEILGTTRLLYYLIILLIILILVWFAYHQYTIRKEDERIIRYLEKNQIPNKNLNKS